jgi:hypothetical protein
MRLEGLALKIKHILFYWNIEEKGDTFVSVSSACRCSHSGSGSVGNFLSSTARL